MLYHSRRVPALFAMAAVAAGLLEAQSAPVSFVKDIKPILETRCLKCHGGTMQAAKLDLRSREAAFKGSEKGPVIVAHKPEESSLYKKIAGVEKPLMPMKVPCVPMKRSQPTRTPASMAMRVFSEPKTFAW